MQFLTFNDCKNINEMKSLHILSFAALLLFIFLNECSTETLDLLDPGKFNADHFSEVPDNAPFNLRTHHEEDVWKGKEVLSMQLHLQNTTEDSILLVIAGKRGWFKSPEYRLNDASKFFFNFAITKMDCTIIWHRIHVMPLTGEPLYLAPGETQIFKHNWDYTDLENNKVEEGKYLIFSTLSNVEQLNLTGDQDSVLFFPDLAIGPDTLVIQ